MPGNPPVIGIVAGEASGDLLGAHLIRALRERIPGVTFVGIAGPKMQAAGAHSLYPMEKLAVRGYVEVLRHYFEIVGIRRRVGDYFLKTRPAIFIAIDAPDFNLDLELRLKDAGIKTVHYVSPSIWAWRRGRITKIKRAVSKMLTLFPFEAGLYEQAGVPVSYVGHPLADMLAELPPVTAVREELRVPASAQIVAMLPGSRVSELKQMAALFIATAAKIAEKVPDALFLVPLVNRETRDLFEVELYKREEPLNLTILFGHALEAMGAADVVLVASGTATLEAALLKRPMVITYRMPRISWWITKWLSYVPYAGLPNILAGEQIVPEFLQKAATPENLSRAVCELLQDKDARARLSERFDRIRSDLRQDTAAKAASAILPLIRVSA
jgi:lipid-A-disaccharide synthase